MKTAYLTVGCPGSGKTTWRKSNSHRGMIIERDEIRRSIRLNLDDTDFNKSYRERDTSIISSDENLVTHIQESMLAVAANNNENVILSNTNLNHKHRIDLVNKLIDYNYYIVYIVFNPSLDTLIHRNNNRVNKVPYDVLLNFHDKLQRQYDTIVNVEKYNMIYLF